MKRTFLAKRNALLSSTNVSWGSVALAVAVLALLLRVTAPGIFWDAFSPAFRASDALAQMSQAFFSGFHTAAALTEQNQKLTNNNAALAAQNEALTEQLHTISGLVAGAQGIIAGVVARPPESPYDTLVLAAGSADGVTLGQEAFGSGTVPLGTVTAVLAHFCRVTLFTSPGVSVLGWVGPTHTPITIVGSGAGTFSALVPRSANIAVGDAVTVPGPGSLPIGIVVRVDSDASSPSVTLRVQLAVNLFSTTWVSLRTTGASFPSTVASTSTPLLL